MGEFLTAGTLLRRLFSQNGLEGCTGSSPATAFYGISCFGGVSGPPDFPDVCLGGPPPRW